MSGGSDSDGGRSGGRGRGRLPRSSGASDGDGGRGGCGSADERSSAGADTRGEHGAQKEAEPAVPAASASPKDAAEVLQATLHGDVGAVAAALDAAPGLVRVPLQGGLYDSRSLLHCAASKGHEPLVRALLARGADAAAADKRGVTASELAAKQVRC
jgi:hypothetical protein